jgi:hypothetical protein
VELKGRYGNALVGKFTANLANNCKLAADSQRDGYGTQRSGAALHI